MLEHGANRCYARTSGDRDERLLDIRRKVESVCCLDVCDIKAIPFLKAAEESAADAPVVLPECQTERVGYI